MKLLRCYQFAALGALSTCLMVGCHSNVAEPTGLLTLAHAVGDPPEPTAQQWPGFRGGILHGNSPASSLPTEWSISDGLKWKVRLPGEGNSSPTVWNDRIYLTAVVNSVEQPKLALLAIDRQTGSTVWRRTVGAPTGSTHSKNGHATATVATDGTHVVAMFGSHGLHCYDTQGQLRWRAELGSVEHQWGSASSPLIFGNLVIQLCDGQDDAFLVAFDLDRGRQVWRSPRKSRGSWTTPVLVHDGDSYQLIVNGTGSSDGSPGRVISYDPTTGHELWTVTGTADIPCPSAIVGGDLIVSTSGGNGPLMALLAEANATEVERLVWSRAGSGPNVPTGIICRQWLFLISDAGVLTCYRLQDGSVAWRQRLSGSFVASLVAGEGRIYAVSEQGTVYVVEASEQYRLLASNRMHERCLATPALVQGEMILRGQRHLFCIGGRAAVASRQGGDSGAEVTNVRTTAPLPTTSVSQPSEAASSDAR